MEREMCGYLEWNLNVHGDEVVDFEVRTRAEHGPQAVAKAGSSSSSECSTLVTPPVSVYPTPETTPDPPMASRPIRPVPSPFKNKPTYHPHLASALPSPPTSPHQYLHAPHSPQPPHFASGSSSLASSPASDDCKTPSPVGVVSARGSSSRDFSHKAVDMSRAFEGRQRQHASNINLTGYPINVGGW